MVSVQIYPTSWSWAGCDTRSIFKQSAVGLNPEFFFSQISGLSKAKELNLP